MPATRPAQKKPAAAPAQPAREETVYGEREPGSLSGNLTRDPELRFTRTGRAVASFSVAVNDRVRNDKTGQWEDTDPEFYDCTAWGTQAENLCEHLRRGDRIVAVGHFQDETYVVRDGERVTRTKFTARDVGPSLLWHGAHVVKPQRTSKSESAF